MNSSLKILIGPLIGNYFILIANARISLKPGETFNLSTIFCPKKEQLRSARLQIFTLTEKWEIELCGVGREAVLIISNSSVDFTDCIVGNSYDQKLIIKNVGDVNYPVSFSVDKEDSELEFFPTSITLQPFSEGHVNVAFTPMKDGKRNLLLIISSPYSLNKIPMYLHSGTAQLEFSSDLLDFGLFEKRERPNLVLKIKNVGTIKTGYSIRLKSKPSRLSIEPSKGLINPNESREIIIKNEKKNIAFFRELLEITSDLIDYAHIVSITGKCEEAILKHEEFGNVNMGICPALDTSVHILKICNYGKFPVTFEFRASYPVRVFPLTGQIYENEVIEISVFWNPSGSFELKSQILMITNIGQYHINVRGKSTFPELAILDSNLNFGVCALFRPYTKYLVFQNNGKVALNYKLINPSESNYSFPASVGSIQPKKEVMVPVIFTPTEQIKYSNRIVVECKGISNKEVLSIGAGGSFSWGLEPDTLRLEKISCRVRYALKFDICNMGDITLSAEFEFDLQSGSLSIQLPKVVTVGPNSTQTCQFHATCDEIGDFLGQINVITQEEILTLEITGKNYNS